MRFFIDFWLIFLFFSIFDFLKMCVALGKITIFKVFAEIVCFQFSCTFAPKNIPKTLPKRSPNPSKFNAKNVLFFNIDFLGFRPRFGRVLGLQVGAKLAILTSRNPFWILSGPFKIVSFSYFALRLAPTSLLDRVGSILDRFGESF